jgi:Mg-chelatase subunit ChlD
VSANLKDVPLFFAPVLGHDFFAIRAEAVATHAPRDIMLVLDFSGSMNDDSRLKAVRSLGRDAVEANLLEIYGELGSPRYGTMQWEPIEIVSDVKANLGLDDIAYPYPSGSWDDYIGYVQRDVSLFFAGYRNHFGYMTLIDYWLTKQASFSRTPDLWRVSAQPVKAVKDGVDLFVDLIQQSDSLDQVGLVIYSSTEGEAVLEQGLTRDFDAVENLIQHRQAGHYSSVTNIGAGMQTARTELEANGRRGALKMMVLMTDGMANFCDGSYDRVAAAQYVVDESQLAKSRRFPIVAISLGSKADTDALQKVAETTNGAHFVIPGGRSVDDYSAELKEVFRAIADHRPVRLVQ